MKRQIKWFWLLAFDFAVIYALTIVSLDGITNLINLRVAPLIFDGILAVILLYFFNSGYQISYQNRKIYEKG